MEAYSDQESPLPANLIHILDYAARPRLWRRCSFRRTVFAAFALVLAAAGIYWYPDISFRIRLAYWQRRCMTHVIPPDKVIFTDDPNLISTLLKDPDYRQTTLAGIVLGAPVQPPSIALASYIPRCCREYLALAFAGRQLGGEVIFMHRLKSQHGIERLVIAFDVDESYNRVPPENCIAIAVLQPRPLIGKLNALGDRWPPAKPSLTINSQRGKGLHTGTPAFRFRPGQLDPVDPSHFTVRWEALSASYQGTPHGVFDFRLSPDGTSVTRTEVNDVGPGK